MSWQINTEMEQSIPRKERAMEILSVVQDRWPAIVTAFGQHIQLTFVALFFAIIIAVPLGIVLTRYRKLAETVIGVTAVAQTIPSLALLGSIVVPNHQLQDSPSAKI
ncbi:MAG: hypothetical protein APF81_23995 [Desulfosporosinus sp. BRH_c37]|nr:MAG: hypothetical protein APF81_23995 [Desulfosporosinus sp. BRH_c37]